MNVESSGLNQRFLNQKKQNNIKGSYYPLFEGLEEYKQIEDQEKVLLEQFNEYSKRISKMLDVIKGWGINDPVSKMYGKVGLGGRIISSNLDSQKVLQEKNKRYLHKLPPGYKDAHKDDEGVGDFIIWSEILSLGKNKKKDLLFVTGEEKSDWWSKSSGNELHVRYELIDEYRRHSEGKSFHIINFSQLLELFGAEIGVVDQARVAQRESEDKEQVVREAESVEDNSSRFKLDFPSFVRFAESSVLSKIKDELHPFLSSISTDDKNVDFVAHGIVGSMIGYEVKAIRHVSYIARRIREVFALGEKFLSDKQRGNAAFRAVFVAEELSSAIDGMEIVKKLPLSDRMYGVIIGYLDEDINFCEIYRSYPESYDVDLFTPF